MYCSKCGFEIDKNAKFCTECGAPVSGNGKKNRMAKKPIYKRGWFWGIIIIFILAVSGIHNADSLTKQTAPAETVAATAIPSETFETQIPVAPTVAVEETETPAVTVETAIVLIESSLKDNFENYNISHKDGIITINLWDEGITIGATLAAEGDPACLEAWNDLVENQTHFCNSIWELVQTLGLTDTAVAVNVLNDGNLENVLLTTMNGFVFYNCVTD